MATLPSGNHGVGRNFLVRLLSKTSQVSVFKRGHFDHILKIFMFSMGNQAGHERNLSTISQ